MHPALATLLHRPQADTLGEQYGAKAGIGSVRGDNLPELTDMNGLFHVTGANRPIAQQVLSAAPIDRVVGVPKPARGGVTQPSRLGGVRPWATDRLSGGHTVIIKTLPPALRLQTPFGGATAGLQRTPPPDRSTGDGCGSFGTLSSAPITNLGAVAGLSFSTPTAVGQTAGVK